MTDQTQEKKHSKIGIGDIQIESWQLEANDLAVLLIELLNHKTIGEYLGHRNKQRAIAGAAYAG